MFEGKTVDHQRFDDLTKTLAGGASRRGALRALAGGAVGTLATLIGRPAAAAPPAGKGPNKTDCCPPELPRLCADFSCRECCADTDCGNGRVCLANGTCASPCNSEADCVAAGCALTQCYATDEGAVCGGGGGLYEACSTNADCLVGYACTGGYCDLIVC